MDEAFFRNWCYTKKSTKSRIWILKKFLREQSTEKRQLLIQYVLDRCKSLYLGSSRSKKYIHNIYHTLKCLFSFSMDRSFYNHYFLSMIDIAHSIEHSSYLHENFFNFFLEDIDFKTASIALDKIYCRNVKEKYIQKIYPKLVMISDEALGESLIQIVNGWGDRNLHWSILFHPNISMEQYKTLLRGRISSLGKTILECISMNMGLNTHHSKRFQVWREVVDHILILIIMKAPHIKMEIDSIDECLYLPMMDMINYQKQKRKLMQEIREDVAYRPGNIGAIETLKSFLHFARIQR